jgi:hypothetical protein
MCGLYQLLWTCPATWTPVALIMQHWQIAKDAKLKLDMGEINVKAINKACANISFN